MAPNIRERLDGASRLSLAGGVALLAVLAGVISWTLVVPRVPSWAEVEKLAAARRWVDLEAGLRRRLAVKPSEGSALLMLGGLLAEQGRDGEAMQSLGRVEQDDPAWVDARTQIAEIAIRRHDAVEAERVLRAAIGHVPRAVEPHRRLVYLLNLERRTAETRSILLRLFEITRDPRYLADCLLARWVDEDVREVGPELEAFWARSPEDPWLRRAWGLTLWSQGRSEEALPHLESAAAAFASDLAGRYALAEARIALGRFDGDLSILGTRPQSASETALWWVLRGRLQEASRKAEEAVESFQQALAADPRNREAYFRLGQALLRRGDGDTARSHLQQAEAIRDREETLKSKLRALLRRGATAEELEQLGQLCREAGFLIEARGWFEEALRLDRRRADLRSDLARLPRLSAGLGADSAGPRLEARSPSSPTGGVPGPPGLTTAHAPHRGGSALAFDQPRSSNPRFSYDPGDTGTLFIGDTMGGGVGLIDYDEDGRLDLYFVNGCRVPIEPESPPRPNKLYRNLGNWSFEDVTDRAGVAGLGYGMGCVVGDFDGDGHDDLFVTGLAQTVLYRNRGNGTFEDVTARAGVFSSRWTTAAGFGDLDGDGDLDLVAITYVDADPGIVLDCRDDAGRPIHCPPHRFAAQFDHLFRNNGDGTFTDVSREAGLEVPEGRGLGLAIADFDGDGRLDLFVANDGTANFLFRNRGGLRFEEVGLEAGVSLDGAGRATASMGVVADDLNGDGLIDLFHTNFINQSSTLRWNLGGGLFLDATLAANLSGPSRSKTGFGTVALDADNDGQLDLFVANGHVDDQPWFNTPMAQTAQFFLAVGKGRFAIADGRASPYFARPVVGRGAAAGDLDNDGRVDLVVVHRDAPAALLRNRTRGGHWLGLRLRGTRSGSTPVGARATCVYAGRKSVRWLTSGTGYLSSNDPRLWFGLGSTRMVEQVEVRWPAGTTQTWSRVPADQLVELREGDPSVHIPPSPPPDGG